MVLRSNPSNMMLVVAEIGCLRLAGDRESGTLLPLFLLVVLTGEPEADAFSKGLE